MSKPNGRATATAPDKFRGITNLVVRGYKSIGRKREIAIRPLTLLAGANSSGKSSMMQPLLLLKQTLEAPYDPGPLLLNGPNLQFRSADEFLSWDRKQTNQLDISLGLEGGVSVDLVFKRRPGEGLHLQQVTYHDRHGPLIVSPQIPVAEIVANLPTPLQRSLEDYRKAVAGEGQWYIKQYRCFFDLALILNAEGWGASLPILKIIETFGLALAQVLHLPAFRGNPRRAYPVTAVTGGGDISAGTFEPYTASVIAHWQESGPEDKLRQLEKDLESLALTSRVEAARLNDTQVEIKVGRLLGSARPGTLDLVNIADVGFGVSQTLPVVVALLAAQPGQLVYLEQPEIHLHPRAQVAMARLLANAANRGVRVVIETHSALLLLGVETVVAEGYLSPDKVKLHWFRRKDTDGFTEIASADLDEAGRHGDWPEDFDDVSLKAQAHYLDTAETVLGFK